MKNYLILILVIAAAPCFSAPWWNFQEQAKQLSDAVMPLIEESETKVSKLTLAGNRIGALKSVDSLIGEIKKILESAIIWTEKVPKVNAKVRAAVAMGTAIMTEFRDKSQEALRRRSLPKANEGIKRAHAELTTHIELIHELLAKNGIIDVDSAEGMPDEPSEEEVGFSEVEDARKPTKKPDHKSTKKPDTKVPQKLSKGSKEDSSSEEDKPNNIHKIDIISSSAIVSVEPTVVTCSESTGNDATCRPGVISTEVHSTKLTDVPIPSTIEGTAISTSISGIDSTGTTTVSPEEKPSNVTNTQTAWHEENSNPPPIDSQCVIIEEPAVSNVNLNINVNTLLESPFKLEMNVPVLNYTSNEYAIGKI